MEKSVNILTGELAGDDVVIPFHVAPLDIRGRAVQLGDMLDSIIARHGYPEPVAYLLGQAVVLTVLLGASLKFDGKFIVQAQSDGPVSLLVADYRAGGAVRAYARFDAERVAEAGNVAPETLLGVGILAMTIDQGPSTSRFQGIVELKGDRLEDVAHQYFRQSEQIPTIVRLSAAQILTPGEPGQPFVRRWRAGGVLTQFLPETLQRMRQQDLPGGDGAPEAEFRDDDAWTEARVLMETIADDELLDPEIGSERLLYRLFHERGVRVFEGQPVRDECSCSREKVLGVVAAIPADERDEAAVDGRIETTCEFCGAVYDIGMDEAVAQAANASRPLLD